MQCSTNEYVNELNHNMMWFQVYLASPFIALFTEHGWFSFGVAVTTRLTKTNAVSSLKLKVLSTLCGVCKQTLMRWWSCDRKYTFKCPCLSSGHLVSLIHKTHGPSGRVMACLWNIHFPLYSSLPQITLLVLIDLFDYLQTFNLNTKNFQDVIYHYKHVLYI